MTSKILSLFRRDPRVKAKSLSLSEYGRWCQGLEEQGCIKKSIMNR